MAILKFSQEMGCMRYACVESIHNIIYYINVYTFKSSDLKITYQHRELCKKY